MKKRVKRAIKFVKEHKKLRILSITAISILSLFLIINFGRYVKTIIENYITRTQRFYFNSDKLTTDNKVFEVNYWSGADSYPVIIDVNSLDNSLRGTDIPIDYTISCIPGTGLLCDLSKTSSTIGTTTNKDTFTVTAVPTQTFQDGATTQITVKARAEYPFEKELSATFVFVVGHYELSYKIEDKINQPYLEAVISNTVDTYKVKQPFGDYTYNQEITQNVYETLSDEDKAKCVSATITLSFNPSDFRLDMTNYYYQHKKSETITQLGGFDYVNSFTFDVKAQTAIKIKFYKIHVDQDYTYPFTTSTPVIAFSAS